MRKANLLAIAITTLIFSGLSYAEVCTYSGNFTVSDAKREFTESYKNLRFRPGNARIALTVVNSEGSNLSGEVFIDQQDKGQYNSNLAFPASGFGGTYVTPTNEQNFANVTVRKNARAHVRFAIVQNGNGALKTGKYTITVSGDGVSSCGAEDVISDSGLSGLRKVLTRVVRVQGASGNNWVDSGINVKKGDFVQLVSLGKVDVQAGWGEHDAFGTTNFADLPGYPLNSPRRYGLVAKINSQRWAYGAAKKASSSGRLYLTCNDDDPDNNTGQFVVTVTIFRRY